MTEDKKASEEITQAGAVELEENKLDEASGGIIAVREETIYPKIDPVGVKLDPVGWKLNPTGVKL